MSRKYPKRIKRKLATAEADRQFMRKLVEAHEEWEKERQAWFRQIPSYDPVDGDQPCIDAEMGDYEHIEEIYVLDAQEMLVNFASEARKLLEEGK